MGLTSGARLGPYEILSSIGAGGMGEVYRARDTALNRDVAIKILPDPRGRWPRLSPDGRWLAYMTGESGIGEVYVSPHPNVASARWQVSTGGGVSPRWSQLLVDVPDSGSNELEEFDVGPDGRFLVLKGLPQKPPIPRVIVNWLDVLKQAVPANGRASK